VDGGGRRPGIPLGGTITSASPAEVRLAEETLRTIKVPRQARGRPKSRPKRLIGDKAYVSDNLRTSLAEHLPQTGYPLRRFDYRGFGLLRSCLYRYRLKAVLKWLLSPQQSNPRQLQGHDYCRIMATIEPTTLNVFKRKPRIEGLEVEIPERISADVFLRPLQHPDEKNNYCNY
jgi:hypothetical protein